MGRQLLGKTVEGKLLANHVRQGECRRWNGAHTQKGYGQLAADGRRQAVHRLAYELWVGPIPAGAEIDHLCRVRDCINPDHLEVVSHHENLNRAAVHRTHCKAGHQFVEGNIYYRRNATGLCRICMTCRRLSMRRSRERRREQTNHG